MRRRIKWRYEVIKQFNSELPYNCQLWSTNDNGKSWWYSGIGYFFADKEKAEAYGKERTKYFNSVLTFN